MDDVRALVDALSWDKRQDPRRAAHAYADKVQGAANALDALSESDPAAARPLLKLAVDRVTRALMYIDSSSGVAGEGLARLIRRYACACEAVPPASTALAKWLCALHFDGPGWPEFRLAWFKGALGSRGLGLIDAYVQERAAVATGSFSDQFAARSFREQLAEATGDVDHYVSVLSEDLRSAHDYLPIVDALRAAGREADAEIWARCGLRETGTGQYTDVLRARLTALLREAGRAGEAVDEVRAAFQRQPNATSYHALRRAAGDAGVWDSEHEPALEVLRAKAADGTPAWAFHLVAILLEEGLVDEAWRYWIEHPEAVGVGQRLELLERRAQTHPGDVLLPYRELIDAKIDDPHDTKRRYQRAITMLNTLHTAYQRARGTLGEAEFSAYIADLRETHRRKPTFARLLDRAHFDSSVGTAPRS